MERDRSLDIVKGLAIILMVIGHCYSKENVLLQIIYSFHMPCFFMISGIIYGNKAESKTYKFSYKKAIVHLLLPYIVFSVLMAIFLTILNPAGGFVNAFGKKLISILEMRGINSMWYLPCICFAEIIFFLIFSNPCHLDKKWGRLSEN